MTEFCHQEYSTISPVPNHPLPDYCFCRFASSSRMVPWPTSLEELPASSCFNYKWRKRSSNTSDNKKITQLLHSNGFWACLEKLHEHYWRISFFYYLKIGYAVIVVITLVPHRTWFPKALIRAAMIFFLRGGLCQFTFTGASQWIEITLISLFMYVYQ